MADERMVPLFKGGAAAEIAVTPKAFFNDKLSRKGEHEMETYAAAGYVLGDRYESLEEYDGPKTQRQHDRAAEERKAEPVKAEAPMAEGKKA